MSETVGGFGVLAVALVLLRREGPPPPDARHGVLDRARLGAMFRLNADIFVRTVCLITTFALFVNVSASIGTAALAATTLLLRLVNLASYMIDGAAFACESLAGIFRGTGDREALRRLFRLSLVSGIGFAALFVAIVLAAPRAILGVLTDHADVVADAAAHAGWLAPVLLLGAPAYIYDGLFLGLTEGRALRNSMLLSVALGFAPAALVAWRLERLDLLWAALALFMAARVATLWWAGRRIVAVPNPHAAAR